MHDRLYAVGEIDRLDLGPYLTELAASLLQFHSEEASSIQLVCEVGALSVSPELAVPVGIIVTEFVTNSLKYAFDGGQGCHRHPAGKDRVRCGAPHAVG